MCVVVAVVVHHKKKVSQVRTRNVTEYPPAARQDATIPPGAAGYTPNQYTPYPQQQQQQQPQYQNPVKGESAMTKILLHMERRQNKFDDNFEDMTYASADYKDLTN